MARTPLFRQFILALQSARRENLQADGLPEPQPVTSPGWTRRKFLTTTAITGLVGLTEGCLSLPAWADGDSAPQVAIIGAGIAGLNAAYQLKKAGVLATVYEARNRVGGRILSATMADGLVVDLGAELINTDHADMLALVDDFGIELFDKRADNANSPYPSEAFYFNGGHISVATLADDLRQLAAQITDDAALLDQDWDTYAPPLDQMSVKDYMNLHANKITKSYLRDLLTRMIHTEYGVEPSESSALQLITLLPVVDGQTVDLLSYSDEVYSVVGGTAQITDALAAELAGQIQLGMKLTEIKRTNGKYRLKFDDQPTVHADIVIVALPFPVLRQIEIDASLPSDLEDFIDQAKLGANEKVIGSFNSRFWRQANGFTGAAWGVAGVSEIWDETQRQTERTDGALNFFLGGNEARQIAPQTNVNTLGQQFVNVLNRHIPGATAAAKGVYLKSGWTRSSYTLGGYANFKPGQLTTFSSYFWVESADPNEQQQVAAGNLIFVGEHLSDEYYGFMNGAAQTGRLAAELALSIIAQAEA